MQALLSFILSWLVINSGLPASEDRPRVEFVSLSKMADVRYHRLLSASPNHAVIDTGRSTPPASFQDVHAMYDEASRTIYLPEGWAADSPIDVSLLVHELVHHLQHAGGLEYDCPEARERPAYQAQERCLNLFGTSLSDEFGLDAMTTIGRAHV